MPVPVGRSRPWTDHRLAVEGMACKYRTGVTWRDVPERFGKWNSIYKRFAHWAKECTWEKLLAEVQKQSDAAGKLDWVVSIDSGDSVSTNPRAAGGCAGGVSRGSRPVHSGDHELLVRTADTQGLPSGFRHRGTTSMSEVR